MNKKLSIVIVTYNSEQLIYDCLNSIYKYNDLDDALEVIVVDNDSSNQKGLIENLSKSYPENLILIKNSINGGYGQGNNLGVKHATSEYIIIMNPDVRILNPIFSSLLSTFENNKNIGMLGVTFADKSHSMYLKPEYLTIFKSILFNIYLFLKVYKMKWMYLSGSFLMFNKKIFIEAGGFDEKIFLYFEEPDISNRILEIGKTISLSKNIKVYHLTQNRLFNAKLASIELDSLEYYLNKFNYSVKRIFRIQLIIYKTKYIIAKMINNDSKKELFKYWIELFQNKLEKSSEDNFDSM